MASCTCANPQAVASAVKDVGSQIQEAAEYLDSTISGTEMGGGHGAPAPVRFCNWAAPEISDIGTNAWSTAFKVQEEQIKVANHRINDLEQKG